MKVTILSGSVRLERQSHKVALYVETQLKHRGVETDVIDLAAEPLPIFGDPSMENSTVESRVKELGARLNRADALIFVTPEYHGSFSGVIKNALDYYWAEFQRKAIGVIAASSGKMGGINASSQLQHVVLSLGAYPVPMKLLVPEVHLAFDEGHQPVNERLVQSTEKFLTEFMWYAGAIHEKKLTELAEA